MATDPTTPRQVPQRVRRARQGCTLALLWTLGCGAGAAPDPATVPGQPDLATSTPDAPEPGASAGATAHGGPGATCHPKCAAWLGEARTLLARADGLGDAPNVAVLFGQAGDAFARGWRGCDLREPLAEDLSCEGASTAIADMGRAYQTAARPDGQIVAQLAALDPRWRRAASGADANVSRIGELATAAEKAVAAEPKGSHAVAALDAAVYGHLAATDLVGAQRAAGLFRKLFGATEPDRSSLQAAAIALTAGSAGDWRKALATLRQAGSPTRAKEQRTKVLWHSARGRALEATGQAASAAQDHDLVLAAWGERGPVNVAAFAGHANPRPMLDRENVMDAVGDGHLYRGRRTLSKAAAAQVPRYHGPATVAGGNDYVKGPFAEWATKRQAMLMEAEKQFALIRDIRPVAPPRPMVTAAGEMGRAWTQFAEAFVQAEPPAHVAADPELAAAWRQSMSEASGRVRENARSAFQSCAQMAARFEVGPEGQRCAEGLERSRNAPGR